jgi:uncharacterized membrane protein YkoI
MTNKPKRVLLIAGAIAGLALGGGAIAGAAGGGGDDDRSDRPIVGAALERASRVAVAHAGGGRVTATEVSDEEGYYEVEVTRADGSQLDVHLDRQFHVLGAAADGDGANDD